MAGEKIATRVAYGQELLVMAEKYPNMVVLDADLSSATNTNAFAKKYPGRFYNCGIAEQNMTCIAAGMSTCGLIPVTNSFAMFAAGRAFEQIRNSIAYPHLNVKIVGSHGGLSVGEDGATHQCNEDIALMRSLPGMTVVVPCDGYEMKLALQAILAYEGPVYLRMCRMATEIVTDRIEGYRFELGKGAVLRDGEDISIVATGITVPMALRAAEQLEEEGISARVIDIHTIKPLDEELILKAARETGVVVTVEEASVIGGLGSAVSELLGSRYPVPVLRHGVNDEFGRSGKATEVLEYYGITPEKIAETARNAYGLKTERE